MSHLAFPIVWAIGMLVFVGLIAGRARLLLRARPAGRLDRVPERLRRAVVHGFGLKQFLHGEQPAGIMHAVVGCDLEVVEPRSGAFVRDWLAAPEHVLVAALPDRERDLTVNGLWTAKEAVPKVRREGLGLDVRQAVVDFPPPGTGWRAPRVNWDGRTTAGWWRDEPGWVMAVAGVPAPAQPCRLEPAPRGEATRCP